MEDGEYCPKKARVVEVKPDDEGEEEEEEATQGGGGRGAVVPAAGLAMAPQIDVRLDLSLLHCQSCLLPLKPPIFKCEAAAGHIVCCYCRAGHGEACSRASAHCGELDAIVGAARVPCPYRGFGCESYVAYHEATEHHRGCAFAPCSCPEHPGCGFAGSRAALLGHLAADHARPAMAVRYGRSWNLSLPLSRRWHALVGEDDDRSVFLVSVAALGAATAVSLVCVRADGAANAAAAPQFWCKLSVELPGEDKDKLVLMASAVGSSALSGGLPAPGQGMFLTVPQELLLSGDILPLSVRIDLLRPAKSTTPHARNGRRGRFID